jgi:hypothetical protein
MLKFKFEDETRDTKLICEKYNISAREFEAIRDEAGTFYSDVRVQHLSSIMRCLEIKGRYITKHSNFYTDKVLKMSPMINRTTDEIVAQFN